MNIEKWIEENSWRADILAAGGYNVRVVEVDGLLIHLKSYKMTYIDPNKQPIYFMRDDHTFRKLSSDPSKASNEVEDECKQRFHGCLISHEEGFQPIHYHNNRFEFLQQCAERIREYYGENQ